MHACGHDIHTTNLIGVARTLAALKAAGPAPSSSSASPPRKSATAPPP